MPTPISDFWDFLIGNTDDHNALGAWKYLFVALFVALVVTSVAIAVKNWREDPSQRSGSHLATWFVRVLVGGMWFQGMLWKLPLPVSGGLKYWTEQMANRAAFEWHREAVTSVYLPYLYLFNPVIFLAEFTFAVSLILAWVCGSSVRSPSSSCCICGSVFIGPAIRPSGRGSIFFLRSSCSCSRCMQPGAASVSTHGCGAT